VHYCAQISPLAITARNHRSQLLLTISSPAVDFLTTARLMPTGSCNWLNQRASRLSFCHVHELPACVVWLDQNHFVALPYTKSKHFFLVAVLQAQE